MARSAPLASPRTRTWVKVRHQHPEMDDAVVDALLGDLDRGDIAGIAQDGGGAVADLAHDRRSARRGRRYGAISRSEVGRVRPCKPSNSAPRRVRRML